MQHSIAQGTAAHNARTNSHPPSRPSPPPLPPLPPLRPSRSRTLQLDSWTLVLCPPPPPGTPANSTAPIALPPQLQIDMVSS